MFGIRERSKLKILQRALIMLIKHNEVESLN